MQTIYTGVPVKDEAAELRRFTGIEFALVHAQPPSFFIIQKRERLSPEEGPFSRSVHIRDVVIS